MTLTDLTTGRGRRRLAWAVPLVVAGGVAAAVALSTATTSSAAPNLAPRTAQQLLVAVQEHAATALSGEVHERLDLGLPTLPGEQSPASLSWQSLLAASHTMRVWADGVDKQRIALLGQLSEADVVHNGNQVWTYTSDTNSVSHSITRPSGHPQATHPDKPGVDRYTPAGAAAAALKAVTPSTTVSVEQSQRVAGRAAYTLMLSPKDPNSTVDQIRIAIDAHRFVPLRFEVLARGSSTPVFDTAFTRISYSKPAASVFDFHKPAGAASSTNPFAANRDHHARGYTSYTPLPSAQSPHRPTMIGSGWTTVAELDAASASGVSGGLLSSMTNPVGSAGARLLHTTLVNALFTPDGRVFVGAVSPAYLERVAAAHPH